MTKLDFLNAVIAANISDKATAYAEAELTKYKASKEFAAAQRREAIQEAAIEYLKANGATKVVDLAAAIGLENHLPMSSACKPLVDAKVIKKESRVCGDKLATFYSLAE